MFLAVIIPTLGRRKTLAETLQSVLRQTEIPDQIIVSASQQSDVDEATAADARFRVTYGHPGTTCQRNRGIDALDPKAEIVCMLDDDVELRDDYFAYVKKLFVDRPDVAGFSGSVFTYDGRSREQAKQVLRDRKIDDTFSEGKIGIGCAMNIRRSVLDKVRFDERLALYGRLEDADFSARSLHLGKQGSYHACPVAHLVEPQARLPGKQYGFSQVMNPFYLYRKGSVLSFWEVVKSHWWIAFGSNTWGVVTRRQNRDYWGRLRGNFLAIWLIVRGRVEPEYIEKI
jgi:glycosyltransferase involved in cell wall biosynthesis